MDLNGGDGTHNWEILLQNFLLPSCYKEDEFARFSETLSEEDNTDFVDSLLIFDDREEKEVVTKPLLVDSSKIKGKCISISEKSRGKPSVNNFQYARSINQYQTKQPLSYLHKNWTDFREINANGSTKKEKILNGRKFGNFGFPLAFGLGFKPSEPKKSLNRRVITHSRNSHRAQFYFTPTTQKHVASRKKNKIVRERRKNKCNTNMSQEEKKKFSFERVKTEEDDKLPPPEILKKLSEICCLEGCDNTVNNRTKHSLKLDYTLKSDYKKWGIDKICDHCYFKDRYKFNKLNSIKINEDE